MHGSSLAFAGFRPEPSGTGRDESIWRIIPQVGRSFQVGGFSDFFQVGTTKCIIYWTIISGWFQDSFVPFLFRMMNDDEFLLDSDMLAKTAGAAFSRIAPNSKAFGSQYLHAVGGGHSSGEISWALAHFGVLGVEHLGRCNRGSHGPDFGHVIRIHQRSILKHHITTLLARNI